MFTLDTKNIVLLGTATAAVFAGAYVLWGPSQRKTTRRKGTCPGLVNLGNTCFLNAILQALAPCCSWVEWLSLFVSSKQESERYLANTILNVLAVLNNSSIEHQEEFTPRTVISALHARGWVIPSAQEQDAHELFHVLTQTLDEEATKFQQVVPLFDIKSLQEEEDTSESVNQHAKARSQCDLPSLPKRDNFHPFRGLLANQLQCQQCHHTNPVKYDTFDSLSLPLPTNYTDSLHVDQLLKQYVSSETVENVECEGCAHRLGLGSSPPPKSTFIKKLTIGKMPQCLCLHIKRTVWLNNGMPMKRYEHVDFPEVINMGQYMYQSKPRKPTTLALHTLDLGARLVGGRTKINGFNKIGASRSPGSTSPTLSVPYSGPVNLLKALNYHSHTTNSGLSQLSPTAERPPPQQTNTNVQRLAHAYTTEALMPANSHHVYRLAAVVVHLGDVFSGHFITYRRAPSFDGQRFPNHWLCTSDSLVKKATQAEVLQSNAYMLFYEKI